MSMATTPRREPLVLDRVPLTAETFQSLRDLLYEHSGIALAQHKLTMVQSRLAKRLRALGLRTYEEYLDEIGNPDSPEWTEFINALTTNLTSFFREGHHFTKLVELLKPAYESSRRIKIWSAGCSTGEEPYTLAMTLLKGFGPSASISILATDLDTAVLQTAARGVYPMARIEGVDDAWRRLAFQRGTGEHRDKVRIRPEVKKLVTFQQLNLLDTKWDLDGAPFQAIFCRNVMIYFDGATQQELVSKLIQQLAPGGYFIVGHSESLLGVKHALKSVKSGIYQKPPATAHE
jgi:chemotaxis protein methyltransferase CheR